MNSQNSDIDIQIPEIWASFLGRDVITRHLLPVLDVAAETYRSETVYPPKEQLFSAFRLVSPQNVRVVILGQDPYHEPGQANGLAFSVSAGVKLPPSLRNIFKELSDDIGCSAPSCGDLTQWAEQGVLLLNTVLTVRAGAANSHKAFGWQQFTDDVIAALSVLPQPISFILWGSQAIAKQALISGSPYPRQVLTSVHPSPLSSYRGFFGSRPFSAVNSFLKSQGASEIIWQLP